MATSGALDNRTSLWLLARVSFWLILR